MTDRLVLATRNKHKVEELADILEQQAWRSSWCRSRTTRPTSSRTV